MLHLKISTKTMKTDFKNYIRVEKNQLDAISLAISAYLATYLYDCGPYGAWIQATPTGE
jgi:hypothetical protein